MRLSDALVAVLAFVGAAIMTWWIRRRHQVEHYISSPVLVLLLVGIFGLFLWTINQVRDFYFGTPVPIVVVPPFILPSFPTTEPVVSLSTLPQELKEIIRKWLDDL
jgi:hypothetical protein